jgi:hypothetical protein
VLPIPKRRHSGLWAAWAAWAALFIYFLLKKNIHTHTQLQIHTHTHTHIYKNEKVVAVLPMMAADNFF